MIREVSRILEEEPRLEAVALGESQRKLAIATLGPDDDHRLADRVSQAIAQGMEDCGHLTEGGVCSACGGKPSTQVRSSRVVVKEVLGSTLIEKQTCPTAISFWKWIAVKWPKYAPREHRPFAQTDDEWKRLAVLAAGCLVLGGLGVAADTVNHTVALISYAGAYLCGGWDAAKDAWKRIRQARLDVHFLMLAVAAGAAVIGAWREGALLLFLFSASGAMEHYAMGRTRREISALLRGAPKTARVLRGGTEAQVPIESLEQGMTVIVTSGEQIPADLEILKGETACDESSLTGESLPISKEPGDILLSGTMNLWGAIEGRVLRRASESALQRIITLIQEAQEMKAPSQKFTDKFGTGYTWTILTLCTGMFFIWWLIFGLPPFLQKGGEVSAFYRAMTLLVVASPCALVLSVPSSILSAIACGARRGVLFRGGAAVETLAGVNVVALDKTGTLTTGELALESLDCLRGEKRRFKQIASSLARLSQHPLSRAIRKLSRQWGVDAADAAGFETLHGQGLRARIDGKEYLLGSRKLAGIGPQTLDEAGSLGMEVWVAGPDVLGRMVFRDTVRPESRKTLQNLSGMGLRTVMLTGDRREAAEKIAQGVGIGEIRAGLLPEQKVAAIQELKERGARKVAMIGDGVNDAPCIAAADVGVAMGARGSDAALEQAEVVLMNDRLENFLLARTLSLRSRRIIYQNIGIALGAVIVMMSAAFLLPIPLALGVAVHEGSTVIVVLNSLRLLLVRAG
ncbi:MAG: cation-translocating P-type ATPase [Terrimicrobiaceae bacterium]